MTFGEIPNGLVVRHKCDNPKCFKIEHLELGTAKDNNDDKMKRGRGVFPKGEHHGMSKLTESDVIEIKKLLASGIHSQTAIAKSYSVNQSHISGIKTGRFWSHITI
ncbi:Phage protein [Yersinia phage fPS-10]|uniref:Phage protein n=1 Tax=Yersinia phage fPS-10 TaxID=2052933 RepID=A0A2H1XB62_9CAUD|nr:Phage protein [Yersinia phage fPS-10]